MSVSVAACLICSVRLASARTGGVHDATPEETLTKLFEAMDRHDWRGVFSRVQSAKLEAVSELSSADQTPPESGPHWVLKILSKEIHGDEAKIRVSINPDPIRGRGMAPMRDEVAHLKLTDGDWKLVGGEGERSMFTQIAEAGRNPKVAGRLRQTASKAVVLSHLKQLALALIMYTNDHNDKYALTQSTVKKSLSVYAKEPVLWQDGQGKPLDVQINPAILGRSTNEIVYPAEQVMLSCGSRGNLRMFGTSTPIAFCDGHVKMIGEKAMPTISWALKN